VIDEMGYWYNNHLEGRTEIVREKLAVVSICPPKKFHQYQLRLIEYLAIGIHPTFVVSSFKPSVIPAF
jgi:hypothetical protein